MLPAGGVASFEPALADLQARHGSQAQGLQSCLASNQALHALGRELLQRYAEWFDDLRVAQQDDWMRIEGVRR